MKVASYSHLSAKIRAMLGKMLKEYDYDQLVAMRDVKSVVLYLKNSTYYQDALDDINENDIHRGYVEVLLYRAELSDSLKIARYLKGADKKIYRFVYRKQEIEDVKKMLRTLQRGEPLSTLDKRRLFVSRYSRIDFRTALEANTLSELLKTIDHTTIYQVLKPLVKGDSIDLFSAEMALDIYYYRAIKDAIKDFASGKDKEILLKYFGVEADIKNIMWIYRGKHYYQLSKEILYRYLIPFRYKFRSDMLDELVEASDSTKFVELLRQGPYGSVIGESTFDWEQQFADYVLRTQLKGLRIYPFSIAIILGYVCAKETEINNITTIIEGVRYGVDPDKIKSSLIMNNT